jgi:hypothetical protein
VRSPAMSSTQAIRRTRDEAAHSGNGDPLQHRGAMLRLVQRVIGWAQLSRDAGVVGPRAQSFSAVILPVAPPDQAGGGVEPPPP